MRIRRICLQLAHQVDFLSDELQKRDFTVSCMHAVKRLRASQRWILRRNQRKIEWSPTPTLARQRRHRSVLGPFRNGIVNMTPLIGIQKIPHSSRLVIPVHRTSTRRNATSSCVSSAPGKILRWHQSRRAVVGRAQLIAKRGHTARVQLQAVVSGSRPPLRHRSAHVGPVFRLWLAEFGKLHPGKISQNSSTLMNICKKFSNS